MSRIIPAACVAVVASLSVLACASPGNSLRAPGPALPDLGIPFEKHVLPNGLTVILHEDHKAPVAAINIWYHVGSKDERPGRTGFAHLFEHLMFNGSENHDDEYFRPLQKAGATKANGTTWMDRTNYFQNVPVSAIDLTLWLESDRMGHLLGVIDKKKLDEQRGVVQNEKRQSENEPYGKVDEVIASSTYPAGHPYSWTTIGSMEDLNAASLGDVKDWFRTHYGAANATLVIAGDINPAEILKKVEHYFGDIPPGPVQKRPLAAIAKMSGEKRALLQDRVPQPRLYKVWNIPGVLERDHTLLDVASDVLGNGKNSRLFKRLVYTDQTATGVSVSLNPFEIGSQLTVDVMVKAGGDVRAVERAIDEELATLLRDGPAADEMDRIKTRNYAGLVRALERVDGFGGKSAILAESQVYGGSPDFFRTRLEWLRNAQASDVRDAARRWLSDGVFVLTVEPYPEFKAASSGAQRKSLPATGTPPGLALPELQRATLSNGLKVVLAERHHAPVVQFNLIVDAGLSADSADRAGTAKFTLDMLDEGTPGRDALQLAARAEELGASISSGSSQDSSYINLSAIKARLPESLDLFADVVLNPGFPEKELARLKPIRLAQIRQEKSSGDGIAFGIYRRLIFGEGHAYANAGSGNGSEAVVNSLTTADLKAFYSRWVRPDNASLLVVGDTSMTELKPMLEHYFGKWRAPADPAPVKNIAPVVPPAKPRVFLVNRSGAEQSVVLATQAAPPKSDPDDIAMALANTVLGGQFTSRLNMNLREDKHWSYGAGSGVAAARGPQPFYAYAAVQTDRTAESAREILKELTQIRGTRPITADELRAAQDGQVLSLPGSAETTGDVAGLILDILAFGLPDTYYNDFVGAARGQTVNSATAAVRRLYQPESLTWIIVGDLEKIEAPVRKLGLGAVTVLDVDGNPVR